MSKYKGPEDPFVLQKRFEVKDLKNGKLLSKKTSLLCEKIEVSKKATMR